MNKPALCILVALLMTSHFAAPVAAADENAPETKHGRLEVSGRAAVAVKPDTALIAFTVESNARQAASAVEENARKAEALLKALRDLMGDGDTLQTSGINLQPVYSKDDRLQPSGYRVSNRVILETVQLERIGDFIDQAAASGAGQINDLQFRSSREADHRTEAAVQAVGQVMQNARKLAQAAGVGLGRVLELRYTPQGPPVVFYEKASMAMGRTPVEIGDLTIEADVIMVFEIQPRNATAKPGWPSSPQ